MSFTAYQKAFDAILAHPENQELIGAFIDVGCASNRSVQGLMSPWDHYPSVCPALLSLLSVRDQAKFLICAWMGYYILGAWHGNQVSVLIWRAIARVSFSTDVPSSLLVQSISLGTNVVAKYTMMVPVRLYNCSPVIINNLPPLVVATQLCVKKQTIWIKIQNIVFNDVANFRESDHIDDVVGVPNGWIEMDQTQE